MLRYFWVTFAGLIGLACLLRGAEHFVLGRGYTLMAIQLALGLGFLGWSLQGFRRLRGTAAHRRDSDG